MDLNHLEHIAKQAALAGTKIILPACEVAHLPSGFPSGDAGACKATGTSYQFFNPKKVLIFIDAYRAIQAASGATAR